MSNDNDAPLYFLNTGNIDDSKSNETLERIELAIAQAAYPDVHPDFTDAGWGRMARAAKDAYEARLAENGLVIVPKEPTEAMVCVAEQALNAWSSAKGDGYKPEHETIEGAIYAAMIQAALKEEE